MPRIFLPLLPAVDNIYKSIYGNEKSQQIILVTLDYSIHKNRFQSIIISLQS
jgi:hypothetical protein